MFKSGRGAVVPAEKYPTAKLDLELDLVEIIKAHSQGEGGGAGDIPLPPAQGTHQNTPQKVPQEVLQEILQETLILPPSGPSTEEIEQAEAAAQDLKDKRLAIALSESLRIDSEKQAARKREEEQRSVSDIILILNSLVLLSFNFFNQII
jgi:hypothetical protein